MRSYRFFAIAFFYLVFFLFFVFTVNAQTVKPVVSVKPSVVGSKAPVVQEKKLQGKSYARCMAFSSMINDRSKNIISTAQGLYNIYEVDFKKLTEYSLSRKNKFEKQVKDIELKRTNASLSLKSLNSNPTVLDCNAVDPIGSLIRFNQDAKNVQRDFADYQASLKLFARDLKNAN